MGIWVYAMINGLYGRECPEMDGNGLECPEMDGDGRECLVKFGKGRERLSLKMFFIRGSISIELRMV